MQLVKLLFASTFILFASVAYAQPSGADRQAVSDLRADWQAVADAVALTGHHTEAANIRAALDAITDEELYLVHGQMDLVRLAEAFVNTAEAFDAVRAINLAALEFRPLSKGGNGLDSPGLPGAMGYPTSPVPCPFSPDRSDADALLIAVDAIAAANVALEIAQGIWSVADRGCTTVAVAIGVAGNPQNALCIITDTVLFVANAVVTSAEAVVDHIAFCDGAVASAEIEGSYERAGHIHSDLEAHDTNIDGDLAAHDANIDGDLAAHDANIDGDLAAHDAHINADLEAHDAHIDADLAQHDADIKALLGNVQTTLELMKRLHIDIIQVEEKKHYLIAVTEAGNAVSGAQLVSLHAGAPKKGKAFRDITDRTTTTELRPGVLEMRLNSLPGAVDSDTIFQFLVEETGHGPFTHSGTALVSGDSNSTFLGPGQ
jgi:hypothetical protein